MHFLHTKKNEKLTSGLYVNTDAKHLWQKRVQFSRGTKIQFFSVLIPHFEWPHIVGRILMCVIANANIISGYCLSYI